VQRLTPGLVQLLGLGSYLAVCIVGGTLGGYLLDKALDTGRILTLVGLLLGLALGIYGAYRTISQAFAAPERPATPDNPATPDKKQ
jgi:F0F1-type ATP synthase assembly protein I